MKIPLATPLLVLSLLAPWTAGAQVSLFVNIGPPPLPVYVQPPLPGNGYVWTPGYWSWNPNDSDYYWIPGTWVLAPATGMLWTPGYWGFEGNGYRWHLGYWADRVGFYGGINYGYGYTGSGYQGGRWDRGVFQYNRAVNNVGTTVVHNVYNTHVVNNYNVKRVSYNGGPGGASARPPAADCDVRNDRRIEPTANQREHEHTALAMPSQRATVNHGTPPIAVTRQPSDFVRTDRTPPRSQAEAAHAPPAAARQAPANSPSAEQARARPDAPGNRGAEPAGGHARLASPQAQPQPATAPERAAPVKPAAHVQVAPAPSPAPVQAQKGPSPSQRPEQAQKAPSPSQRPDQAQKAPAPAQRGEAQPPKQAPAQPDKQAAHAQPQKPEERTQPGGKDESRGQK